MTERQLTVCAIALVADGNSAEEVARALGVGEDHARFLIEAGATEQSAGTMGYMQTRPGRFERDLPGDFDTPERNYTRPKLKDEPKYEADPKEYPPISPTGRPPDLPGFRQNARGRGRDAGGATECGVCA